MKQISTGFKKRIRLAGTRIKKDTSFILAVSTVTLSFVISIAILPVSSIILKTLIDVNVALIGFWGLILVYILGSLHTVRERVETQCHETNVKLNELSIQELQLKAQVGVKFNADKLFKKIQENYEARDKELEKRIQGIKEISKRLAWVSIITTSLFVASILCSMWGIASENSSDLFLILFLAVVSFFLAIVTVFFAIAISHEFT
jgi:hypothetical protein